MQAAATTATTYEEHLRVAGRTAALEINVQLGQLTVQQVRGAQGMGTRGWAYRNGKRSNFETMKNNTDCTCAHLPYWDPDNRTANAA